jgi:hypothetical protein
VALNLVSLAVPFPTPDTIERATPAHGSDRTKIRFVISGAMPALLVAFNNVAVVGGSAALFAAILRQSEKAEGSWLCRNAQGEVTQGRRSWRGVLIFWIDTMPSSL